MAGYAGYLVKINGNGTTISDFIVPFNMMFIESFKCSKNEQDMDSYVDADGNLQRNALSHWRYKCEWTIPPMKKNPDVENFFKAIRDRFINETEKSVNITAYVPELGDYHTGKMYLNSSVEFEIYRATPQFVQYKAIRVAFIEY